MRADNYFTIYIEPRLLDYLINRETIFKEAGDTKHERFDFFEIANNRLAYIELVKALVEMFPLIILRDHASIKNGFWIIGKEKVNKVFLELLFSTIKAIERDLTEIINPTYRRERRNELIRLILKKLENFSKHHCFNPREVIIKNLAKEYRKSIPALKNKKAFYAK